LERYEDKALEKNLFLHSDVHTDDATLYTDKHRLGEILHQYLDNALKFTTEGGVTIGYDIKADSIRLWVRDTGIGIDENHLGEHLFDRFVKIDEFVPGTGLGLSICRRLALSLDGKVGVESQLGEGSCFWVELPNR
jgi:signal transduction histidine kinase